METVRDLGFCVSELRASGLKDLGSGLGDMMYGCQAEALEVRVEVEGLPWGSPVCTTCCGS